VCVRVCARACFPCVRVDEEAKEQASFDICNSQHRAV
jgi:hypothetical protein